MVLTFFWILINFAGEQVSDEQHSKNKSSKHKAKERDERDVRKQPDRDAKGKKNTMEKIASKNTRTPKNPFIAPAINKVNPFICFNDNFKFDQSFDSLYGLKNKIESNQEEVEDDLDKRIKEQTQIFQREEIYPENRIYLNSENWVIDDRICRVTNHKKDERKKEPPKDTSFTIDEDILSIFQ
jgi:hypothetical protein